MAKRRKKAYRPIRFVRVYHGFQFGALLVQRATSLSGGRVCVSITSDRLNIVKDAHT